MAAKALSVSLVLGGMLGSGWVSSIGQAKKDISLIDRMTAGLNNEKKGMVFIDPGVVDRQLQVALDAGERLRKARADAEAGGNTAELKERVEFAKQALAAADKSLETLERRMGDQRKAAFLAGMSLEAYARRATALDRLSAATHALSVRTNMLRSSWGKFTALARSSITTITAISGAIYATVNSTATAADATKRAADRLGLGMKALQEYRHAARQAGMANEDFDNSADKLNISIGKAVRGDARVSKLFQRYNINARAMLAMPADRRMEEMADVMSRMSSETERATFAQTMFGDGGGKMVEMLKGGKQALKTMRDEASKKGAVMFGEEDVAKSRKFITVLSDMKTMFAGIKNAIALGIMDKLQGTVEAITAAFAKNRDKIITGLQGIITLFSKLLPWLTDTVAWFISLSSTLVQYPTLAKIVAGGFIAIGGAIAAMRISALAKDFYGFGVQLAKVIPNLGRYAATTKLAAFWELAWNKARRAGAALGMLGRGGAGRGITSLGSRILPMLRGILPRVLGFAGLIGGAFLKLGVIIKGAFLALGAVIGSISLPVIAVVAAIVAAGLLIWKFWNPIKKFFLGLGAAIWGQIGPPIQSIRESFASIWKTVSPTLSAIWGGFQWLAQKLAPLFAVIGKLFIFPIRLAFAVITRLLGGIWSGVAWYVGRLASAFVTVWNAIDAGITWVRGLFMDFFGFDPLDVIKETWGKAIEWLTGKLTWLSDKLDGFLGWINGGQNKNATPAKAVAAAASAPALNPPPLAANNRKSVAVSNNNTYNITTRPGQDTKAIAAELAREMERRQAAAAGASLRDLAS